MKHHSSRHNKDKKKKIHSPEIMIIMGEMKPPRGEDDQFMDDEELWKGFDREERKRRRRKDQGIV